MRAQLLQSKVLLYSSFSNLIHPNEKNNKLLACVIFAKWKDDVSHTLWISSVSLFPLHSQASPAAASAQKCPAAVPNAKNVKQMLLDWCRAKTEPYEVNTPWLSFSVNYCPCWAIHSSDSYVSFFAMIPSPLLWNRGWTSRTSPPAGKTA